MAVVVILVAAVVQVLVHPLVVAVVVAVPATPVDLEALRQIRQAQVQRQVEAEMLTMYPAKE